MKSETVRLIPRRHYFYIFGIAVLGGLYQINQGQSVNGYWADMIGVLIAPNFATLVLTPLFFLFLLHQILVYKSIAVMVAVRGKTELLIKRLLNLIIFEVSLAFVGYYGPFSLTGRRFFADGPVWLGILILLLYFLFILILGLMLIGAYWYSRPGLLVIGVLLLTFIYHYWFQLQYLLIRYSPVYDPLWRAMHHFYG